MKPNYTIKNDKQTLTGKPTPVKFRRMFPEVDPKQMAFSIETEIRLRRTRVAGIAPRRKAESDPLISKAIRSRQHWISIENQSFNQLEPLQSFT